MEREQFKVLVKAMKAVYAQPTFIPDQDAFNVWFALLGDLPYKQAELAVQKHMATEKFPPTIADIREKAEQITSVKETEMSELEAWAIVRKAIGRSNYYAEEEFEKLPEACKMAVGNPSNLREWAMMDSDQVGTVEQVYWRIWIRKRIFLLRKSRNKEVAERSFWKSDAEFYRIRHTRIRNEADGEDKPKMVSKEEEKRMKQDSAGQFSQCNRCGARIMWVKTKAGKNMPVDPQFVDFKKIKGGKERLVLPNGEVVAGERCKAKEADGY